MKISADGAAMSFLPSRQERLFRFYQRRFDQCRALANALQGIG